MRDGKWWNVEWRDKVLYSKRKKSGLWMILPGQEMESKTPHRRPDCTNECKDIGKCAVRNSFPRWNHTCDAPLNSRPISRGHSHKGKLAQGETRTRGNSHTGKLTTASETPPPPSGSAPAPAPCPLLWSGKASTRTTPQSSYPVGDSAAPRYSRKPGTSRVEKSGRQSCPQGRTRTAGRRSRSVCLWGVRSCRR